MRIFSCALCFRTKATNYTKIKFIQNILDLQMRFSCDFDVDFSVNLKKFLIRVKLYSIEVGRLPHSPHKKISLKQIKLRQDRQAGLVQPGAVKLVLGRSTISNWRTNLICMLVGGGGVVCHSLRLALSTMQCSSQVLLRHLCIVFASRAVTAVEIASASTSSRFEPLL